MLPVRHILTGWAKTLGLLPVSAAERKLQQLRLRTCGACPDNKAAELKVLRIVNGGAERVATLYCTECSCPCSQKAMVVAEECPLGHW